MKNRGFVNVTVPMWTHEIALLGIVVPSLVGVFFGGFYWVFSVIQLISSGSLLAVDSTVVLAERFSLLVPLPFLFFYMVLTFLTTPKLRQVHIAFLMLSSVVFVVNIWAVFQLTSSIAYLVTLVPFVDVSLGVSFVLYLVLKGSKMLDD